MPTKEEEQDALANIREDRQELVTMLGESFGQLLAELDAAQLKITSVVDSLNKNLSTDPDKAEKQEEVILRVLRYLSCTMATKAGLYAAAACIEYNVPPPLAFETTQNSTLSGFLAAVVRHRDSCASPDCSAVKSTEGFLDHLNETFHKMNSVVAEAEAVVSKTPRDNRGKPIVH